MMDKNVPPINDLYSFMDRFDEAFDDFDEEAELDALTSELEAIAKIEAEATNEPF